MTNKYADKSKAAAELRLTVERLRGSAKMCMHKHGFKHEADAKKRAAEITAEGTPMRYYKCPHCYDYHLARIKPDPATCRKETTCPTPSPKA